MTDLSRLLRPRSIAVVGGQAAARVIAQCLRMGYAGRIHAVNRNRAEIESIPCVSRIEALPEAPDAVFLAVGRDAAVEVVAELEGLGAGGVVCHSSGFAEAGAEGTALQRRLLSSAGGMPLMGPNCYGFVNYLDGVPLWPDQHGGKRCDKGVAIVSQSGNMAINVSMQRRGLPVAYLFSLGNQAQLGASGLLSALIEDDRVTAVGLLMEGVDDLGSFDVAARTALEKRVPVIALKTGRSRTGGELTLSHTASLAGADEVFDALLRRLGIARVHGLGAFLETLKLLHVVGPLSGDEVVSISSSGGEASLVADSAEGRELTLRPFSDSERERIEATVNSLVRVSNPFDYHTFDWGDEARLRATFEAVLECAFDLALLVVDFPRSDRCEDSEWWTCIEALRSAIRATGRPVAVVATLPECLPEETSIRLLARGILPLAGIDEALAAVEAAAAVGRSQRKGPTAALMIAPHPTGKCRVEDEYRAKLELAEFGLSVPESRLCDHPEEAAAAAAAIGFPVAVKLLSTGVVHKSDVGGVVLGLRDEASVVRAAADYANRGGRILVEAMVDNAVAELIVGASYDRVVGLHMLVGAGGELVELSHDSSVLTLPFDREVAESVLSRLRCAPLLHGYRGRPEADVQAAVEAILQVGDYVVAHCESLVELDINPLLVRPKGEGVVVVDALIRKTGEAGVSP